MFQIKRIRFVRKKCVTLIFSLANQVVETKSDTCHACDRCVWTSICRREALLNRDFVENRAPVCVCSVLSRFSLSAKPVYHYSFVIHKFLTRNTSKRVQRYDFQECSFFSSCAMTVSNVQRVLLKGLMKGTRGVKVRWKDDYTKTLSGRNPWPTIGLYPFYRCSGVRIINKTWCRKK